jgi:O-succinylbenzoate synthase
VKIKIAPGWDLEPLAQIRHAWPLIPLMVDANAAYTAEHIELLSQLDRYNLMMIEQPMAADALDASARLQTRIQTPICLDESASSLEAVRAIAEKGAGRIINIKMQRVGGVLRTRQMHDLAQALELPCWIGTMPELGVASAVGLHAATMANCTFETDIESSERWFVDDVLDPAIAIDAGGLIHIPDGPGIGYQVNPDKIEKYTIRRETIRP